MQKRNPEAAVHRPWYLAGKISQPKWRDLLKAYHWSKQQQSVVIHSHNHTTSDGSEIQVRVENQFWDQTPILGSGGLGPELLDPMSELDAENAPIVVVGLSSMLMYFSCPSNHGSLMQRCLFGQALKSNTHTNDHIDLMF
jgi:hypothetical protein